VSGTRWARGPAVAAALALAACGGRKAGPTGPEAPPMFRLGIEARPDANRGGPVYVVIRKTDTARFLSEDYEVVAAGLFGREPDPRVLGKRSVAPGQNVRLEVARDLGKNEVLGVYALFSAPGADWRLAVLDPAVTGMRIVLGRDRITSSKERR